MSELTLLLSQTIEGTGKKLSAPLQGTGEPPADGLPPRAPNPARTVADIAGRVTAVLSLPMDLINAGVAAATNVISDMLPKFPAAHLTSLYVGIPHAHSHPPSLIPPAPPVPLPSIGCVLFGTCVQVWMGGLPAARAGDIGIAPTCVGFAPFFTIFLGSSKVFVGGMRAARVTDICTACTPSKDGATRAAAAAAKAASKAAMMAATVASVGITVLQNAGKIAAVAGAVADAADAATEEDANLAAAQALSAGMAIAQLAADAIAMAMTAAMGKDPAIPPALPGFLVTGAFNVHVAGMPFPNIPDPAQWLLKKLKLKLNRYRNQNRTRRGGGGGCP